MTRPTSDHHYLALWLVLVGAGWASLVGHDSTAAGVLIGAGIVWLALVE